MLVYHVFYYPSSDRLEHCAQPINRVNTVCKRVIVDVVIVGCARTVLAIDAKWNSTSISEVSEDVIVKSVIVAFYM